MSSEFAISATTRTISGKQVKRLRAEGLVPAVVYGHGKTTRSLSLNTRDFTKLYDKAGSTALVALAIDEKKTIKVLIQEVQSSAIRREVEHVDFYEVNLKEKLRTNIPVVGHGTSDAVELNEGILITVKDEVEVECLPDDLVQELVVDLGILKTFEDSIKVSDITAPQGMVILADADEVLFSVAEPRSEEELEELDADIVDTTAEVESETTSGTDTASEETEETESK